MKYGIGAGRCEVMDDVGFRVASRRSRRVAFFAIGACLGFAGWVEPALAQREATPVTSPIQQDTGPPAQGPDDAAAAGELGISLGSFRLYPVLDLRAGYDTNVFASPAGSETGSAYEVIRPSFDLRSNWSNHMLNFGAYGVFGFYNNANSQNYQNFGVNLDGRLDIQRFWYLTASVGFNRTSLLPGTPDVAFTQEPTVAWSLPISLSMYQRFNRLFYQATVGLTGIRYQDAGQIAGSTLPAANRDRTEYAESLRVGYEVFQGMDFWAQGTLNQRRYVDTFNVDAQNRNSNGWAVTGGATIDLSGITRLEGFVGYTQQSYDNPGTTTSAVSFGLGGIWNGYQPLVVKPFVVRTINETAYVNYQDYISTSFGVELIYTIRTDWQLNAGGAYSLLDYTPVPGAPDAFTHTDNYYRASLGLLYSIRPQIQIGPLYEFSGGSGPDPLTSPNFTRHAFLLRIVAKR